MKNSLQQHLAIALHIFVLVVTILIAVFVSHTSKNAVERALVERITAQEKYLLTLAEITDRNGADDETAVILSDCPRRLDYEAYLVRLATLTKQELVIMQNLFDACSPFYVEQKALMVSRLERELKSYIDDIALLATLRDVNDYSPTQENFAQLTEIERQKSELMFDQTNIQSKIITLLISGKSAQGAEVAALLKDAQSISEFLSVLDHRVDAIRDTVTE